MEMAAARLDRDREEKVSKIRLKIQNRGDGGGVGGGVLVVGCCALIAAGIGAAFAARRARDRGPRGPRDPESSRGEVEVDRLVGDQLEDRNDHRDGIGTTQKLKGSEVAHFEDFELQEEEETESSSTEGDGGSEGTGDASVESNEEDQAWRAELPLDRVEDGMASLEESEAAESSAASWPNHENKIVNNTGNVERHCQDTEMGSETLGTQSISTSVAASYKRCMEKSKITGIKENQELLEEFGEEESELLGEVGRSMVEEIFPEQEKELSPIDSEKIEAETPSRTDDVVGNGIAQAEEPEVEDLEVTQDSSLESSAEEICIARAKGLVGKDLEVIEEDSSLESNAEEIFPEEEKELSSIDLEKIEQVETPMRNNDMVGIDHAEEEQKLEDSEVIHDSSFESSAEEACPEKEKELPSIDLCKIEQVETQMTTYDKVGIEQAEEEQKIEDSEVVQGSSMESSAKERFTEREEVLPSIDLEKIEVETPKRTDDMIGIEKAEEGLELEDSEVIQDSSWEANAEEIFPEEEKEFPSVDLKKIEQVEPPKSTCDMVGIAQAEEVQKVEESEAIRDSESSAEDMSSEQVEAPKMSDDMVGIEQAEGEDPAEENFPKKKQELPSIDLQKIEQAETPKRIGDNAGIEQAEEEHIVEDPEVNQGSSLKSSTEEIFSEEEKELPSIDIQKIEQVETSKRIGDNAGIEEAEEEDIVEDPEVNQDSSLKSSTEEIFPEEEIELPSIDLQKIEQVETPKRIGDMVGIEQAEDEHTIEDPGVIQDSSLKSSTEEIFPEEEKEFPSFHLQKTEQVETPRIGDITGIEQAEEEHIVEDRNDHRGGIVQELPLGGVEEEEDGTTQPEIEQKLEGSEVAHDKDFYHQEDVPFIIELQEEEETESSAEGEEGSEGTVDASTESNEEEHAWRAELPLDRVEDSIASLEESNHENKIVNSEVVINTRENEVKANMDDASTPFEEGTCHCIKLNAVLEVGMKQNLVDLENVNNTENVERDCQNTEMMGSETLGTQSISNKTENTEMVMEFGANIDNGDDVVKELSTSVVASYKQCMEKSEITSLQENQELLKEFGEEETELLSEVGRSIESSVEETIPEQGKELSSINSEKIEVETPLRTDDIVGNGIAQAEDPKEEDLEVTQDSSLESSAEEICPGQEEEFPSVDSRKIEQLETPTMTDDMVGIAQAEGQVVEDLEVIEEDSPLESNAEEIFPEEEKELSSIDLEKIEQVETPVRNNDMVGIAHAEEEQKLEDSEVIQDSSFESSAEETCPEKEKELPSIDLCKIEQVETQKTTYDMVGSEEEQKIEVSEVGQGSSMESSAEEIFPEKEEVLPSIDLEKIEQVETQVRNNDMVGIAHAEEEQKLEALEVIRDSSFESSAEETCPEKEKELPSIDLCKIEQIETQKTTVDMVGIEQAEEGQKIEDSEVVLGSSMELSAKERFPEREEVLPSIDLEKNEVGTPKRTDDMIGIEKAEEGHELEDSEVTQDSSWESNAEEIFPEEEKELPLVDLKKIEQVEPPKSTCDMVGIAQAEEAQKVEESEAIRDSESSAEDISSEQVEPPKMTDDMVGIEQAEGEKEGEGPAEEIFPKKKQELPSIDLQKIEQAETPKRIGDNAGLEEAEEEHIVEDPEVNQGSSLKSSTREIFPEEEKELPSIDLQKSEQVETPKRIGDTAGIEQAEEEHVVEDSEVIQVSSLNSSTKEIFPEEEKELPSFYLQKIEQVGTAQAEEEEGEEVEDLEAVQDSSLESSAEEIFHGQGKEAPWIDSKKIEQVVPPKRTSDMVAISFSLFTLLLLAMGLALGLVAFAQTDSLYLRSNHHLSELYRKLSQLLFASYQRAVGDNLNL